MHRDDRILLAVLATALLWAVLDLARIDRPDEPAVAHTSAPLSLPTSGSTTALATASVPLASNAPAGGAPSELGEGSTTPAPLPVRH